MTQKIAYVTGGMGGIGTAICQRLHQEGFKVIAGCGPTRDFKKWLDEQAALGFTFYASAGDVSSWESTVEAFAKAKAELEATEKPKSVATSLEGCPFMYCDRNPHCEGKCRYNDKEPVVSA